MPKEEYSRKKIWDESHPDYNLFQKEVDKLKKYNNLVYNFH